MRRALKLMQLLGDGAEHSGADLADALGVTRAAVWNQVSRLREEGVAIEATQGQGYVLTGGFEALDPSAMERELSARDCAAFRHLNVIDVTDSTNERLLNAADEGDIHGTVLFAEYQTAGRGRRGDKWMSPPGSGLCFSLAWRFDNPPATFSALSLVVGVAIARTLREFGVADAGLKWPNDVVREAGKLAGILIELRAEVGGPALTVIGIGLNIRMSETAHGMIDRPSDDFANATGAGVSRNLLAAALLNSLAEDIGRFADSGFRAFHDTWLGFDALAGREITLDLGERRVQGTACGVDAQGAFLIEHDGGREAFVSGHISQM